MPSLGCLKSIEILAHFVLESPIRVERQDRMALWPGQSSRPLHELASDGTHLLELPKGRTFGGGGAIRFMGLHLKLPVQIVGEHGAEQVGLVGGKSRSRDILKMPLGLELGESSFLGTPTIVKSHGCPSPDCLVGNDDLELVSEGVRLEEIQLDSPLASDRSTGAHRQESVPPRPALGFPGQLEVGDLGIQSSPPTAPLYELLEFNEPGKWDGDAELYAQFLEHLKDVFAEEGAIHAGLDHSMGQDRSDLPYTGTDELSGPLAVVSVSRPVKHVEDLTGLGNITEQRIVAALPFLARIESHRRSFGPTAGTNYRSVKIQSDSAQTHRAQAGQYEIADQSADFFDSSHVDGGQDAAYGRDVGQTLQGPCSSDHRVFFVEFDIPQLPISQEEVNDQPQNDGCMAVDVLNLHMAKARAQPRTEIQTGNQCLEQDQAREGRQLLAPKPELRKVSTGFMANLFSAKLHFGDLTGLCGFCREAIIAHTGRLFHEKFSIPEATSGES